MTRSERRLLGRRLARAVSVARRELRNPAPVTWTVADRRSGGDRFGGLSVLVTGAAGLIGSALVEGYVAQGALVHAADQDGTGLEALGSQLVPSSGRVITHVLDLADPRAIHELAGSITRLDILVNNVGFNDWVAGIGGPGPESWHHVLDVNLVGPAVLSGELVEKLSSAAPRSSVLFVTSTNALAPARELHYGAAKAALAKLSRDMAAELAPRGVRVNAIAPGWTTSAELEPNERSAPRHLLGSSAVPVEAIVQAAQFLSDPAASPMTTGQHLVIDGGAGFVPRPFMKRQ